MDNDPVDAPVPSTRSHSVGKDKKYPDEKYVYPDICPRKRKMRDESFHITLYCATMLLIMPCYKLHNLINSYL
jgi:hypothetical protein